MLSADVCIMVTSQAIVHSPAAQVAQKERVKLIAMEEITPGILASGAASADYEEILEHGRRIREYWNDGSEVHVTSPDGMDLTASIEDRPGYFACGKVEEQPGMDLYITAFPDGEASISPVEGTASGTIVWDTSMHEIGLFEDPIRAEVEDGYVTEIRGGREAARLRQMLENAEDPEAYNLAEIAIGINPEATITGSMREDKKAAGYLHLAVGANADTGGTVHAPVHIDGIASNCTLTIDGETIVEDGTVMV
jgi:leucyl aminopeptidase (aminopeptidase T)